MMKRLTLGAVVAAMVTLTGFAPQTPSASVSEYPQPDIREQQTVIINGVRETWQLKWIGETEPVCAADADSCPCQGFGYGERGDAILTRSRNGLEIDRLRLTGLFEETFPGQTANIQRWQPDDKDNDAAAEDESAFLKSLAKRPIAQVMHLADYDHDGLAAEFYLPTDPTLSCESNGVVIGISRHSFQSRTTADASKASMGSSPRRHRPDRSQGHALRLP
jgi:hypothetical protein